MHGIEKLPVPSRLYAKEYRFKLPLPKQLAREYYLLSLIQYAHKNIIKSIFRSYCQ